MRHTPGPWSISILNDLNNEEHWYGINRRVQPTDEEIRANANLISAGPELLEACKLMNKAMEDVLKVELNDSTSMKAGWDAIREAIAKAERIEIDEEE